ncbi:hypothetical protein ETB97_009797 [Aspergillus alliaceus]|uniref:DUF2786 domain-containing protein n=1 Tax=Petromyces alliaceus TaxID=209559 RepID=A0A8H6E9G5_PETAA|nr:hypothetical protein ETB97_009797 [Aspergillus burnettii]
MGRRKQRQPVQKAAVTKKARDQPQSTTQTVDKDVLGKIQKCLSRATHESTTESEAKAALFLAHKLMAQYNVTQVDLVANSDDGSKARYGGRSIVTITNTKDHTKWVVNETFVGKLAMAMCTFFDCQRFSTHCRTSVMWTFFGVAENTVAAAMAFEMAHNRILDWACSYKRGSTTFSYCIGVADGLVAMANREKKVELEMVRKKELDMIASREREEAIERQRETERLYNISTLAGELAESEDESGDGGPGSRGIDNSGGGPSDPGELVDTENFNGGEVKADFNETDKMIIDLTGDVDDNIDGILKRESREIFDFDKIPTPSVKQEVLTRCISSIKGEDMSSSPWTSETQLVRFRATSVQVADDYLKKHNIKLRTRKARRIVTKDFSAYKQGWKDSQKIDLHQRRLE